MEEVEEWKALFVYKGEVTLVREEERHTVSAGQVVLCSVSYGRHWVRQEGCDAKQVILPLDVLHKYSTSDTDFTSLLWEDGRVLPFPLEEQKILDGLFWQIEEGQSRTGFGSDVRRELALVELLLYLAPLCLEQSKPRSKGRLVNERIAPILNYMEENVAEPLSLDEIASRFYVSKHYLCRMFKEQTGTTVLEYLVQCRMEKARSLLEQGHSVQRAGELSGFSDNSHFIRTFGGRMGTSPGRYAKEFRRKGEEGLHQNTNHKEEADYERKKE